MSKRAPYFVLPSHKEVDAFDLMDKQQLDEQLQLRSTLRATVQANADEASNEGASKTHTEDSLWLSTSDQYIAWLPSIDVRLKNTISYTRKRSNAWLISAGLIHVALFVIVYLGAFGMSVDSFIERIFAPAYVASICGLAYSQALARRVKRFQSKRFSVGFDDFINESIRGHKIC